MWCMLVTNQLSRLTMTTCWIWLIWHLRFRKKLAKFQNVSGDRWTPLPPSTWQTAFGVLAHCSFLVMAMTVTQQVFEGHLRTCSQTGCRGSAEFCPAGWCFMGFSQASRLAAETIRHCCSFVTKQRPAAMIAAASMKLAKAAALPLPLHTGWLLICPFITRRPFFLSVQMQVRPLESKIAAGSCLLSTYEQKGFDFCLHGPMGHAHCSHFLSCICNLYNLLGIKCFLLLFWPASTWTTRY